MRYHVSMIVDQKGNTSTVIVGTLSFLIVALLGLSGWALYQYNQERTTVQQQIDQAVEEARESQRVEDEERFEEERQNPYRTYSAPGVFGSINIDIPRNWNMYAEESTSSRTQIDLAVHPDIVREQSGPEDPYAFRMQLEDSLYQEIVSNYQRDVEREELQSRAIEVSGLQGVRLSGAISRDHNGVLVVLPYRDKTILLWTEGSSYRDEFDVILQEAEIN